MIWIVIAAIVLVAALAVASPWLVGPVFFYEILRAARRGRFFLLRGLYVFGMFLLLVWVWLIWWSVRQNQSMSTGSIDKGEAQLAEFYFYAYAVAQYVMVLLLTPAYVAGCIADDKERRILDFLLATDLANREIVFGKMLARVGNLLLFLITGLPILSFMQFFGGIDPLILLLSFAATGMTMLGIVGVSMVNSVQRRRVRDAVMATYLIMFAYVAASSLLWMLSFFVSRAPMASAQWLRPILSPLQTGIDILRWGNPISAYVDIGTTLSGGGQLAPVMLDIAWKMAVFYGTVFSLGVAFSIWRLRAIALRQSGGEDVKSKARVRAHRAVSERPMIWKEVWVEGTLRPGLLLRLTLLLIFLLGFAPVVIMAIQLFDFGAFGHMKWSEFQVGVNIWLRVMNPILTCLLLIGIAVRAAGSVGGERDKDTLLCLLTSPLTAGEIIGGKFWGAIASVRTLGYGLLIVWLVAVLTGSVSILAVPVQLVAMFPPAAAAAAIGLYCSVVCRTTLRALTTTVLSVLFGLGGHWFVGTCACYMPIGMLAAATGPRTAEMIQYPTAFEVGLTPPAVFALIPFTYSENWFFFRDGSIFPYIGMLGHASWMIVAAVVGFKARDRFAASTNRAGNVRRAAPATALGGAPA